MISYLMILLADILLSAGSVCSKKYQQWRGVSSKSAYFSIAVSGIQCIVLFFCLNNFKLNITPFSLIMAVLMNIFVICYTLLGRFIIKNGTLALYSLFLMTGGMVVPYIWGLLFLNEKFSILRTIGLILIILAVSVSNKIEKKTNYKFILLCFSVFLLNGFVSVVSKVHQIETIYQTVGTNDFILLGAIFRTFIMGIMLLFQLKKHEPTFDNSNIKLWKVFLLLALSTTLSNGASFLLLQGAKNVPATVLYPLNTGGTIIFTAFAGRFVYKEKLSKNEIFGIIVCFIGTLMFL